MKNAIVLISILLFCYCKKENLNPTASAPNPGGNVVKAPLVKTEDFLQYTNGNIARRIHTFYNYDNLSKPSYAIMKDTDYVYFYPPRTYTLNYTYNAFGKIALLNKVRSDMTFFESYEYDSNNTIRKIRYGSSVFFNDTVISGIDDSLIFRKENNLLISENNAWGNYRSYYSANLDSTRLFWGNDIIENRRIITRSSKEDLAYKHFNSFLPFVTNKHEAVSEYIYDYPSQSSTFRTYEREYDQNGFPVKITYKENATIISVTHYSYY